MRNVSIVGAILVALPSAHAQPMTPARMAAACPLPVPTPISDPGERTPASSPPGDGLPCYPNCDQSSNVPILNVADFACFANAFANGLAYANCDNSSVAPVLNINDFTCFVNLFAAGCT